jgi:threonyl-tRNA synthetase
MLGVLDFFRDLYGIFGFTPDRVDFSTRPEDSMGDDEEWDLAEKAITDSLDKAGLGYVRAEGEGTYYGPKIDIHVRDAIGRMWQMCTVQVDVQLPQRFDLEYVDADGSRKRPVMIHRALYGSVERFMGVLVEHFAGAFPTWLAPVQATIIPIADRHGSYADEVLEDLRADGYRITVDDSDNTMRAKIRNAQMAKIPYMLVVGDDEAGSRTLSVRTRSGGEERNVPVPEFRTRLRRQVEERSLDL